MNLLNITDNLADFGAQGLDELKKIIDLLIRDGFPSNFYQKNVRAEYDKSSGEVFLINDSNQIVMMTECGFINNRPSLERYYRLGDEEGFLTDLLVKYENFELEEWDLEELADICDWCDLRDIGYNIRQSRDSGEYGEEYEKRHAKDIVTDTSGSIGGV